MALNRILGEKLDGLDSPHTVEPFERWLDTPFMEIAATKAADAFIKSGALRPINFDQGDILIQAYHRVAKLAFIFQRKIAGDEKFYAYTFDLDPNAVAELVQSGRWIIPTSH
jgi:hypothetical protein